MIILTLCFYGTVMYSCLKLQKMQIFYYTVTNIHDYFRTGKQKEIMRALKIFITAIDKAKVRLDANVNFEVTIELMVLTIKE